TSADRKTITIVDDVNGDGANDRQETIVTQMNGTVVDTVSDFNPNGSLLDSLVTTTSAGRARRCLGSLPGGEKNFRIRAKRKFASYPYGRCGMVRKRQYESSRIEGGQDVGVGTDLPKMHKHAEASGAGAETVMNRKTFIFFGAQVSQIGPGSER